MNVKEIAYRDRSEFLRGFAIIIRKNNCVNTDEKTMFSIIGKYFGFEEEFCKESFEHITTNKYISEEPAVFSTLSAAEFFINDVAKIMQHTNLITDAAKEWMRKTAEANQVHIVI